MLARGELALPVVFKDVFGGVASEQSVGARRDSDGVQGLEDEHAYAQQVGRWTTEAGRALADHRFGITMTIANMSRQPLDNFSHGCLRRRQFNASLSHLARASGPHRRSSSLCVASPRASLPHGTALYAATSLVVRSATPALIIILRRNNLCCATLLIARKPGCSQY